MIGFGSVRSAIVRIAVIVAGAAVVAGCSGGAGTAAPADTSGAAQTTGATGIAAAEPVLDVAMDHEVDVNGLKLRINRVVVQPDRVQVAAILHNAGDAPYSLLLGGCGPSQGRVSTGDGWREVYYQVQPEGDLSGLLDPGESRRGTITLKPAAGLDPQTVTRLQLHPGYVLNAVTGRLELLQVMLALEEGGTK